MNKEKFPRCKPNFPTLIKLGSGDFRIRYKTLRNISSYFTVKPEVRNAIFEQKGKTCYLCGSSEDMQLDHVISVYKGAKNMIPYDVINSFENLMPICRRCNSGKRVI